MTLQQEIDSKAKEIHTDGYPMSIGEIINLYKLKEIDIHPEFQRFFRWKPLQKTKLIESILLGIPLPSIFVSQREDGVWDVVDGLQRLSSIFEFVGVLRKEDESLFPASRLLKTEYLPSLEGKQWENEDDEENSFTTAQRLAFKRQKIDVKIIKKESDKDTKYELFQRLNTGGTSLSPQEVRNCLLVMINKEFFEWIKELANYPAFLNCISISDKAIEEQFHLELVLRFLVYKNTPVQEIRSFDDLGQLLTDEMVKYAEEDGGLNREKEEHIFKNTFDLLDRVTGDQTFKKYDEAKGRFLGAFLISSFEVIAIGIGSNIEVTMNKDAEVRHTIQELWGNDRFKSNSGSGLNARDRLPHLIPLGKELFRYEN